MKFLRRIIFRWLFRKELLAAANAGVALARKHNEKSMTEIDPVMKRRMENNATYESGYAQALFDLIHEYE